MKKFLAILLSFILLLGAVACNRTGDDGDGDATTTSTTSSTGATTTTTASFVKPENYVAVIEVSINPLFRLYLDAEGVVLAVECVNADAASMAADLAVVDTKYEEAVCELVTVANSKGFVKADTVVQLAVVEQTEDAAEDLLEKAEDAVSDLADTLELTLTVETTAASTTTTTASTTATTKPTTTTTTTKAVEYTLKENTYFSYTRPMEGTDFETQEKYLYLLRISFNFYPNGGSFMDGEWNEPVFSVFTDGEVQLIPKTDYPACQQNMVDYWLGNYQAQFDDPDLTWADLFERDEIRSELHFTTYNGVEYLQAAPGYGGFSMPFYSYTLDSKTGAMIYSSVYEEELMIPCEPVSLKLTSKKTLLATVILNDKQETLEMTAA